MIKIYKETLHKTLTEFCDKYYLNYIYFKESEPNELPICFMSSK